MKPELIVGIVVFVGVVSPVRAATLGVSNGNFTQGANSGSVGCTGVLTCLIGGSGTDVNIGSGPWQGTWAGVAGLLAPPTLTISTTGDPLNPEEGLADISGLLAGTSISGTLLDDSGDFFQNTGSVLIANQTYTLTADITTGELLSASILANAGVGIEVLSGSTVLASSTDGVHLISFQLLSGDTYREQVQFTTGATPPTSPAAVELFDNPSGLASANVLANVEFSEVTLTSEPNGLALAAIGVGLIALAGIRKRKIFIQ